jgi:lipid-binding SYLF domain-containing protein
MISQIAGWRSSPCLVSLSGLGIGLQAGLEKDLFALVMTNKNLINTLKSGRDFAFGGNIEVTVGKTLTDDEYQRSPRENLGGKTYLYAQRNGVYLAAALESSAISVRRDENQMLYPNLTTSEIISGNYAGTPQVLVPLTEAIHRRANMVI